MTTYIVSSLSAELAAVVDSLAAPPGGRNPAVAYRDPTDPRRADGKSLRAAERPRKRPAAREDCPPDRRTHMPAHGGLTLAGRRGSGVAGPSGRRDAFLFRHLRPEDGNRRVDALAHAELAENRRDVLLYRAGAD